MEVVQTEIVAEILSYLGGKDFVNFRRTCKRLKEIADYAENCGSLELWYKYVFRDFSTYSIASVAPWLYTEDRRDAVVWKTLYICLHQTSGFKHHQARYIFVNIPFRYLLSSVGKCSVELAYNHLVTRVAGTLTTLNLMNNTAEVPTLDSIKAVEWRGGCIDVMKCDAEMKEYEICFNTESALILKTGFRQKVAVTVCDEFFRTGPGMDYFNRLNLLQFSEEPVTALATWANFILTLPHDCLPELQSFRIIDIAKQCGNRNQRKKTVNLLPPFGFAGDVKSLCFNDRYIIWRENHSLCLARNPDTSNGKYPVVVNTVEFEFGLETEPRSLKLVGNFLLLKGKTSLFTAHIADNQENRCALDDLQALKLGNEESEVLDFDVKAHVFVALSKTGVIYLSVMQQPNHSSLMDGMTVFEGLRNVSCLSLSLDIQMGIKFAVLCRSNVCNKLFLSIVYVK